MTNHDILELEDPNARLDFRLWAKILRRTRPYTNFFIGLGICAALLALVEVLLVIVVGQTINYITAKPDGIADDLPAMVAGLKHFAGQYVTAVIILSLLVAAFIYLGGKIATGMGYDIRRAAFTKLQSLPFAYFNRRPVGWLMSRLTSDCDRLSRLLGWALLDFVWGITLMSGIAITMFVINWKLAFFALSIIPPLAIISRYFQKWLLESQRDVRRTNSHITAAFNEAIMGVRTTRSLVRESENLGEFQTQTDQMFGYSVRNALCHAVYMPIVITLGALGTGLVLWQGGIRVSPQETGISFGELVIFLELVAFSLIPIQELASRLAEIQAAQAAAERIQELLDTEPAIKDSPEVIERINCAQQFPRESHIADDGYPYRIETIEFDDVTFAYDTGETVLENFNLSVEQGQTIALVGPTGGGKSTIVNLMCRFYEPTSGRILINGMDYRERSLHWLQSNLGMVLQTPHLFKGSIADNIRYGNIYASREQIIEAATLVNADQFISQTTDGYDTEVGEGGSALSMGEKQLVALARAILANSQVFVMDEATSSVDTEAERLIQQGVDRVLADRISFVIAHRLSTIRSADRILVIEQGRIAEQGTHRNLLNMKGQYFDLYTSQFTRERQSQILANP